MSTTTALKSSLNLNGYSVGNRIESCYVDHLPNTVRSYNSPISPPLSVNHTGSWSQNYSHPRLLMMTEGKSSLLDSHDRFKPERVQRRPVLRMKWPQTVAGNGNLNSRWSRSLAGDLFSCHSTGPQSNSLMGPCTFTAPLPLESESRVTSMNIADVSPRIAVKKVLVLYEHGQYREAACFLHRLSVGTFRIILRELPVDVFVDAMPQSLPIVEALYTKVFSADGPSVNLKPLKPETVLMHMVKFFSREPPNDNSLSLAPPAVGVVGGGKNTNMNRFGKESMASLMSSCKDILRVIVVSERKMMRTLVDRRKALDKAVEGLGQHGLVGTTDQSLLPLHDALKLEFRRVVDTYKGALQKLEELSLSAKNHPKSVAHGPAPILASHQRQLSLRAEDIQERLIKNKSLLNAIDPTLDNHCLDILLGILQRRIECDKEALFQFTQLRREAGASATTAEHLVAPLLMRFSRGCKQVLELMREVVKEVGGALENAYEDEDSSDLSGYHSDSDSAIMTSGNSPFVTPRARYNFISRSVRSKTLFRPALLLSSVASSSSSSSTSGVISGSSRSSSAGPLGVETHSIVNCPEQNFSSSTTSSNTPIRPRHIKLRNQLQKNNSLASSTSSGEGSDSSSVVDFQTPSLSLPLSSCVECVTLVSVNAPDDQVITQGVNHRCPFPPPLPPPPPPPPLPPSNEENDKIVRDLREEISQLRRSLQNANASLTIFQQQQQTRNAELRVQSMVQQQGLQKVEGSDWEERRNRLIREYGALYAQARVETMDALDCLPELAESDELKSKLLFSVVVLAFRAVQLNISDLKSRVKSILEIQMKPDDQDSNARQSKFFEALNLYLCESEDQFNLSQCVEQVAVQLYSTLYDYPCLKRCTGLMKYIWTCTRLFYKLQNQNQPFVLEYERKAFSRDMHVRFHSSNQHSDEIKTYIWPGLLGSINGKEFIPVQKAIVIT